MWRCEWIWQTYCWVMVTSIALGLVTTILGCSSVVGFLVVLVKIRLILADDVLFHLPCAHAHVGKIGVNSRRVVIHLDLARGEHAEAHECHEEHHLQRRIVTPACQRRRTSSRKLRHDSWQATDPSSRSNRTGAHVCRRAGVVRKDHTFGTTRGRRARRFPRGKAAYGSERGVRAFVNNATGAAPESEGRGRHSAAA